MKKVNIDNKIVCFWVENIESNFYFFSPFLRFPIKLSGVRYLLVLPIIYIYMYVIGKILEIKYDLKIQQKPKIEKKDTKIINVSKHRYMCELKFINNCTVNIYLFKSYKL